MKRNGRRGSRGTGIAEQESLLGNRNDQRGNATGNRGNPGTGGNEPENGAGEQETPAKREGPRGNPEAWTAKPPKLLGNGNERTERGGGSNQASDHHQQASRIGWQNTPGQTFGSRQTWQVHPPKGLAPEAQAYHNAPVTATRILWKPNASRRRGLGKWRESGEH